MRGEHCVAAASTLSGIAVILLIFANIGQVSSGVFTGSIYLAEVNVAAYGAALESVSNKSAGGLYDTKNVPMGSSMGLRQYYRYGMYNSCGYQKAGSGICNSTTFGYPMEPLAQILSDTPAAFKIQTDAIIPAATFKDNSYNHNMSHAGSVLIFIGSVLALFAVIFGVIPSRICFLFAAASAGISAFFLMIGCALWTALISKDAWLKIVHVQYGDLLGIYTTAGPTLYLSWVAFAMITLSIFPYVISCCTFRK